MKQLSAWTDCFVAGSPAPFMTMTVFQENINEAGPQHPHGKVGHQECLQTLPSTPGGSSLSQISLGRQVLL